MEDLRRSAGELGANARLGVRSSAFVASTGGAFGDAVGVHLLGTAVVVERTDAAVQPSAYTAVEIGTPVQTIDGQQFGTVGSVLVVEDVDVFDGIVVDSSDGQLFVDAGHVDSLTTAYVRTTLSEAEAKLLPPPGDRTPSFGVDATDDTGSSISDRIGRAFGRSKWTRES